MILSRNLASALAKVGVISLGIWLAGGLGSARVLGQETNQVGELNARVAVCRFVHSLTS
jgi:hypothetical protein